MPRRFPTDPPPTPATGLTLAQLRDRCIALADKADKAGRHDLAMQFSALGQQFVELVHVAPDRVEDTRNALTAMMVHLIDELEGPLGGCVG